MWSLSGGEALFLLEGSEWIQKENRKCLLLEGGLPLILIIGMGQNLSLRVCLLPVVLVLKEVVDETLHSFLQLNVRLVSG